jgi:polysaccharide deacetylase family protein (PEP-CTERM system associated)
MGAVINAMTVDVEDYFHVSAFADIVTQSEWDSYDSRVCRNTDRLLGIFDEAGVRATFFVLGWVADRFPALVQRIHAAGHELASHSYDHGLVYHKTPETFRADLRRARAAIAHATGVMVQGYRAPSYSITERSLWALDVLVSEGYTFDSSIYPIRHDRYGIPSWRRCIHRIDRAGVGLWELPGSTVRHLGTNLPMGGGGYFRILPYWWTYRGIQILNEEEGRPAIFYLHPWEIDPDQPRLNAGALARRRHYYNLDKTESRLRRLLKDFRFGTVAQVLSDTEGVPCVPPAAGNGSRRNASEKLTFFPPPEGIGP